MPDRPAEPWVTQVAGSDIESPCIQVCVVDVRSGLCSGCGRTLAEIASWGSLTPAERRKIMDLLPARTRAAPAAPGE
jgi:predicted Fe-S protein YdhL (DUF1289 family)